MMGVEEASVSEVENALEQGLRYVNDADYRRRVLVGSLVKPDNTF